MIVIISSLLDVRVRGSSRGRARVRARATQSNKLAVRGARLSTNLTL